MPENRSAAGALGVRAGRRRRPDEWAILAGLLLAVGLCLSTGTGFDAGTVLAGYLQFFARFGFLVFALARVGQLVRLRWRPRSRLGGRALAALGGPARPGEMVGCDLEFLRGFALLLATITVYTNLKLRIPLINSTVGDDLFQALDDLLLGERLVPAIEAFAAGSPFWTRVADRFYHHGFVWMMLLVVLLWIRTDRPRMRWLFASFCLVYLSAIFVTLVYPSYGPFFLDWQRFGWARQTESGYVQAYLVDGYLETLRAAEQGRALPDAPFRGIAAFPSLHIAFMAMLAVVAWRTVRPFAIFMIGVAVATTISTLVFGWHYFVDALGGVVLAVAIPIAIRRFSLPESAPAPHGAATP